MNKQRMQKLAGLLNESKKPLNEKFNQSVFADKMMNADIDNKMSDSSEDIKDQVDYINKLFSDLMDGKANQIQNVREIKDAIRVFTEQSRDYMKSLNLILRSLQ